MDDDTQVFGDCGWFLMIAEVTTVGDCGGELVPKLVLGNIGRPIKGVS